MDSILIGTCSWDHLVNFYPPRIKDADRLRYYATRYSAIEVNSTAYGIPSLNAVLHWIRQTPDDFIFDIKPPRELTKTPDRPNGRARVADSSFARKFETALRPLVEAGKLGTITFQFPPAFHNTAENRDYIRALPELFPGFAISIEFRHRGWLDNEHAAATFALLAGAGLGFTMVDMPQIGSDSVPPIYAVTNRSLAVFRFHGQNKTHWRNPLQPELRLDWDYTSKELAPRAEDIKRAAMEAEVVHVFFNTKYEGQEQRNIRMLGDLLGMEIPYPDRAYRQLGFGDMLPH